MATAQAKQGQQKPKAMRVIRNVYLYLVAMIGLITFIFGSVGIINNILQRYVFQVDQMNIYTPVAYPGFKDQCSSPYPDPADPQGKLTLNPTTQEIADCRKAQDEQNKRANDSNYGRDLSISLAQIGIGLPIWLFHWGIIQKEYKKRDETN